MLFAAVHESVYGSTFRTWQDAADLIAKTAIQFCQNEFSAYLSTLPESIEKMAVRQALLDQFQREAETKALTAILDLRAK